MSKTQAAPKVQGNERINFSSAKGKIETPDFWTSKSSLSRSFSS
jgi:hypothetical protein